MMTNSDVIYKYMGKDGAHKTISNCSLRFARPSEMNDPFDVYIDDLFNIEVKGLLARSLIQWHDLLCSDPATFAKKTETDVEAAYSLSSRINKLPESERVLKRDILDSIDIEQLYPDMKIMRENLEAERLVVVERLKSTSIFCATKNNSNLLMWAHYAEKHEGVVLGFRPDLERDSFLRLLKPVIYTDQRPQFYEFDSHWKSDVDQATRQRIGAKINTRMIYSKSKHWAYEEELRLDIPSEVKEGEPASFLKFYPTELVEIYFGCRMSESNKTEILILAKKLNPSISAFNSRLANQTYELEFDKI